MAGLLGQLVEGLDLSQDLMLADHDGIKARRHAKKMPDRLRAAPREEVAGAFGTAP